MVIASVETKQNKTCHVVYLFKTYFIKISIFSRYTIISSIREIRVYFCCQNLILIFSFLLFILLSKHTLIMMMYLVITKVRVITRTQIPSPSVKDVSYHTESRRLRASSPLGRTMFIVQVSPRQPHYQNILVNQGL